ncbi:MAG: phosphoadenylyl-sulfate reductase [Chloroflexi bacterium]|nr:phosphoadenylyl-sulfate reductase [Chloroflexota bacterium]
MLSTQQIDTLSKEFESKTPQEIIQWAVDEFLPEIALSSSFQTQSMPLLHMVANIKRSVPVFFIDTGYHLWETLMFREWLASEWKLNVIDLYRDPRWNTFVLHNIRALPFEDPNLCCYLHKVQPMQKALKDLKAWISGIRRDQTAVRAQAKILELQEDGLLKVNPLLNWTKADISQYAKENNLPSHPLLSKGYRSVGCAPCTIAIGADEDERAGRWAGRGKVECGLHTDMFKKKDYEEVKQAFHLEIK